MNCLGRNLGEPECSTEAAEEAEEVTRRYEAPVVGSVRSRGVAGVMPGENKRVHSKGSTVYRKGKWLKDAILRNGNNRDQAFPYSGTREEERLDAVYEPCSSAEHSVPPKVLHEP